MKNTVNKLILDRGSCKKLHKKLRFADLVFITSGIYEFQCNLSDLNYIGYTSRHLHLCIEEHKYSVIGKHPKDKHNQRPTNLHEQFTTLKKCCRKFECLVYEMLLIWKKRPTLNTQNDSIPAKLFI